MERGHAFFGRLWPEARAVSDPSAELYATFGLGRKSVLSMFDPRLAAAGLRAIAKGNAVGLPQGDPFLEELRLNSADIDGDLHVTIADLQTFANDFYGAYRYRSDLRWDGMVNLSDVAAFAAVLGTTCP